MTAPFRRRACSLVTAVALLVAAAAPVLPVQGDCSVCRPGCPMHARRVGCHRASHPSCHRNGLAPGLRNACGHAREPGIAGGGAVRAVMPARRGQIGVLAARAELVHVVGLITQHLPEPPTDPPRAPLA